MAIYYSSIYETEKHLAIKKEKRDEMKPAITIGSIVTMLIVPIGLFLAISYIIHWFTHDNLTNMQNFKWSLDTYWFLYLYIVIAYIFLKTTFHNMMKEYENLSLDILSMESNLYNLKKEEEGRG